MHRVRLSVAAQRQLNGFPEEALGGLAETMAWVLEYPDDPLRSFPMGDPYVRQAEFGGAGLVTYRIDDGAQTVTLIDVIWAG